MLCYVTIAVGQSRNLNIPDAKPEILLECGTPPMPDSIATKQKWYGNNNYLLQVLKENGYELPPDYFDEIDERGYYKGSRLNIDDYKKGTRKAKPSNGGRNGKEINGPKENLVINGRAVKYIRLKVYIHLDDVDPNWTVNEIDEYINSANRLFSLNRVPIIFYTLCSDIRFINNSVHYTIATNTEAEIMWILYGVSDAMNVHFVNTGAGAGGIARSIGGTDLLIARNSWPSTLAHELGHCLGLQHTHNAKSPCNAAGGNQDCADCWQEPVSRTRTQPLWCTANVGAKKCAVYGDGLCDTPGEPKLSTHVSPSCTINWSSPGIDPTNNWGAQWVPMEFNVMSYATNNFNDNCRDLFSAGQIAIMLATVPSFATTADPYVISGPGIVCANNTSYSYSVPSLPGVTNYTWQVPAGSVYCFRPGIKQCHG